ncbi:MAG TPA: VWA domain-containing protein [Anaeromyxobacter sp.]
MTGPGPRSFSLLGYALRLEDPRALRLLAVVAALAVLAAVALAHRRRALVRAAGTLAPVVAPAAGGARPAARAASSLLGLALLALALARPQCGTRAEIERRAGIDLVIVLDASRSMLAADVAPDRLGRAKLELSALLDGLAGDRVALVPFAGEAWVACPLTTDYAAAKLFLRSIEPQAMPRQGTGLAEALDRAREALLLASGRAARSRVVLVVSDGEDHEGNVASAARALADAGVRIFALGVGTAEGAPVPPRPGARARRETAVTRLDPVTLRLLADVGRGELYGAGGAGGGLAPFRAELDKMERTELEGRVALVYEDRYALAAFPAFLLLLAGLLLPEGRSRSRSRSVSESGPRVSGSRSGRPAASPLPLAAPGGEGQGEGAAR